MKALDADVIVIGAGPGGSTTAALLAKQGVDVLVFERDEFPRFHIGESLLPSGLNVHDLLGLEPDDDAFIYKRGARFVCEATDRTADFDFAESLPGCPKHAWQVERAKFDSLVRDRARAFGATIQHGVTVRDVEFFSDRVVLETSHGQRAARYLVDASGQLRFLARKMKTVEPYREFGKAAVFTHFTNLSDEAIDLVGEGNDIRIMMVEEGWVWIIPLPGRRLSLGIVNKRRGINESWLDTYLETSPTAQRMSAGAERGATRIESNYSFKNTAAHGARYACVGDAASFLDPVFSSGVSLAMNGGKLLAARVARALQEGDEGRRDLMDPLKVEMSRAYETFAAFIHRFYNRKIVENLFFGAPPDGEMRSAVVSVLAGDVWRQGNAFQDMLLSSKRTAHLASPHA